jgi:hypothetical protein
MVVDGTIAASVAVDRTMVVDRTIAILNKDSSSK